MEHAIEGVETLRRIVRRILLYLGIASASLAGFALLFFASVRIGIQVPFRWVGFVLFTALLSWLVMRQYRDYWSRLTFWLASASLLAIHVAIFVFILRAYPKWSVIWFWPLIIIEAQLFSLILDPLFVWTKQRQKS